MTDTEKGKLLDRLIGFAKKVNQKRRFLHRVNQFSLYGNAAVAGVENAFSAEGLVYFATCGTLLGLIRENRLLKRDYDLDYGVLIEKETDWQRIEKCLLAEGFEKIRYFSLDGKITEQTYRNTHGVEIDIFGHFIIDHELCFYSYDKLPDVQYPSEDAWTAYILKNGSYQGVKKIETSIGVISVPKNAEEYLTYNYNDDWRIPDPNFKANTGKGCFMLEHRFGRITLL